MRMEIIGVDNGYGLTKTAHCDFVTALTNNGTVKPPFLENAIEYNGNYYLIGGERMKVMEDKTENQNTYILTLAAIAEELSLRGLNEADITLSVGLPLERCGTGAKAFSEYFKKEETESFSYKGKLYKIRIPKVLVSPQGYSAIVGMIKDIPDGTVLVDIGSWTIDISQIIGGIPQKNLSLNDGVINCILTVNDAIRRETGNEVMEAQIQNVMRCKPDALPEKYTAIARREIQTYAEKIAATLQEYKFNLETLPFVFVGGGATIIKNFGMHLFPNAKVITDIHANAKGYEEIAKQVCRRE